MSYQTTVLEWLPNNTLFVSLSEGEWMVGDGSNFRSEGRLKSDMRLATVTSHIRSSLYLVFHDSELGLFLAGTEESLGDLRHYVRLARQYPGSTVMTVSELTAFLAKDGDMVPPAPESRPPTLDELMSSGFDANNELYICGSIDLGAPAASWGWKDVVQDPMCTYSFLRALQGAAEVLKAAAGEPTSLDGVVVEFQLEDYLPHQQEQRDDDESSVILVVPDSGGRPILVLPNIQKLIDDPICGPYPGTVYEVELLPIANPPQRMIRDPIPRTIPLDVLAAAPGVSRRVNQA